MAGKSKLPQGVPELDCYPLWQDPPPLIPARAERAWMSETTDRFAYRCLPLSVANASGWEIALPFAVEAAWFGGTAQDAVQIRSAEPLHPHYITSHFGHGVLTFHTGWLLRTSPGWAVWARGSPNQVKDGIAPLDGLVETDWLPFPFTMNWRFTRPGVVRFEADEPFCFVTLAPHGVLDAVRPRLAVLDDDPQLKAAYAAWGESRADFNARLKAKEESAVAEAWQRNYVRGRGAADAAAPGYHVTRRRLQPPA